MYLRDTGTIKDKHHDILRAVSQEVIDLMARSLANTYDLAGMSMVETDTTMGDYIDKMD